MSIAYRFKLHVTLHRWIGQADTNTILNQQLTSFLQPSQEYRLNPRSTKCACFIKYMWMGSTWAVTIVYVPNTSIIIERIKVTARYKQRDIQLLIYWSHLKKRPITMQLPCVMFEKFPPVSEITLTQSIHLSHHLLPTLTPLNSHHYIVKPLVYTGNQHTETDNVNQLFQGSLTPVR